MKERAWNRMSEEKIDKMVNRVWMAVVCFGLFWLLLMVKCLLLQV